MTGEVQVFATIGDFEARHGVLPPDDLDRVTALLSDASALISAEAAGSDVGWIAGDPNAEVPAVVTAVCVQVAYRAWRNPDGIAREQLGEMAVTYRGGHDPDAIYLTRNERRMVRRAAGKGRGPTSIELVSPYSGPPTGGPPDFAHGDLAPGSWTNGEG